VYLVLINKAVYLPKIHGVTMKNNLLKIFLVFSLFALSILQIAAQDNGRGNGRGGGGGGSNPPITAEWAFLQGPWSSFGNNNAQGRSAIGYANFFWEGNNTNGVADTDTKINFASSVTICASVTGFYVNSVLFRTTGDVCTSTTVAFTRITATTTNVTLGCSGSTSYNLQTNSRHKLIIGSTTHTQNTTKSGTIQCQ
jgi:hypothetical protein